MVIMKIHLDRMQVVVADQEASLVIQSQLLATLLVKFPEAHQTFRPPLSEETLLVDVLVTRQMTFVGFLSPSQLANRRNLYVTLLRTNLISKSKNSDHVTANNDTSSSLSFHRSAFLLALTSSSRPCLLFLVSRFPSPENTPI